MAAGRQEHMPPQTRRASLKGYDPFANPARHQQGGYIPEPSRFPEWRNDVAELRGGAEHLNVRTPDFQAHVGHGQAHVDINTPNFQAHIDTPQGGIMDAQRRMDQGGTVNKAVTAAGVGAAIWQQWSNISNRMNRGQQGPAQSLQDMMRKGGGSVKKKDNRKIIGYDENNNPIYK